MRYVLWSFLSISNGLYTEIFGPNIVDDMTYEKTKISLHEGEVIGRIVTVNDVDVEIFRGDKLCVMSSIKICKFF